MTNKYLFFNILLSVLTLSGCQTSAALNSERINDKYGSYGVEILHADSSRRVTNLYSGSANSKTMRTLAVVDFESAGDPRLAVEHAAIVAGGSIGAVFKERGWQIHKDVVELCEQKFSISGLPALAHMRISLPRHLAVYRYRFQVVQNDITINYARITEVYHPDFLSFEQLLSNNYHRNLKPVQTICSTPVSD